MVPAIRAASWRNRPGSGAAQPVTWTLASPAGPLTVTVPSTGPGADGAAVITSRSPSILAWMPGAALTDEASASGTPISFTAPAATLGVVAEWTCIRPRSTVVCDSRISVPASASNAATDTLRLSSCDSLPRAARAAAASVSESPAASSASSCTAPTRTPVNGLDTSSLISAGNVPADTRRRGLRAMYRSPWTLISHLPGVWPGRAARTRS